MAVRPSVWLLWLMTICCLKYNTECRRYDRCTTRDGLSGICVSKRFCRVAATLPKNALTVCPDASSFYCCPVPTSRTSAEGSSFSGRETTRRPSSTLEPPTRRNDARYQTPETKYRPDTQFGSSRHPSRPSSSVSQEDTYRYPDRSANSPGTTREKQVGNSGSGTGHFRDDERFSDDELRPTKKPRHDDQDRRYVPNASTKPAIPNRATASPSRGNNRSPAEKHTPAVVTIHNPEEDHRPQRPFGPACGRKPYELFIAGGEESKQHEWPWMVAIFRRHATPKPNSYICGGSLINNRYILSAAHCFIHNYVILPTSTFIVRLGAHYLDSGEDFTVADLIVHHNHSGSEFFNDIALLRLASEVFFTDKIAPICLPTQEMRSKSFVDRDATVAGWGATAYYRTADSRVLQHVSVPVLSNEECSAAYSRVRGAAFLARGTDHTICAGLREGGKDACLGDSGGPLMLKTKEDTWTVIGIVSLGYKCAEPGYPGVYTRVTHYLSWIYSNMKNF